MAIRFNNLTIPTGFLKAFPTSRTIDTEELHDFARQIARGMEHLEMKGITHRWY